MDLYNHYLTTPTVTNISWITLQTPKIFQLRQFYIMSWVYKLIYSCNRNPTVHLRLQDGVPEKGRVAAGTVRWFSFATHLLPVRGPNMVCFFFTAETAVPNRGEGRFLPSFFRYTIWYKWYIYHYISIRKVDASVAYPFIPMNFEPFRQEPRAISLRAQVVAESPRILLDRWETLTVLICIDILHIIYDYTIHIESMRGTSI